MRKKQNHGVAEAVEKTGSTRQLARLCGVTQPSVMKWLHTNCPAERAVQIENITGVPRESIRPDLWDKK
ncbi:hypothetical protein EKK58_02215 [Candidatus Dependentiae bacterium]|nr:MAG: hypothetical protein EKK58_02215 [Candidatus Dependentiae bacterium]